MSSDVLELAFFVSPTGGAQTSKEEGIRECGEFMGAQVSRVGQWDQGFMLFWSQSQGEGGRQIVIILKEGNWQPTSLTMKTGWSFTATT